MYFFLILKKEKNKKIIKYYNFHFVKIDNRMKNRRKHRTIFYFSHNI